jgi:hypothetical protein
MTKRVEKVLLSEAQERYLDIYHKYFVLHWDYTEIMRYHRCSKNAVSEAVNWVIENKLQFPSMHLLKGAIDAISVRLKKNKELYTSESDKRRYRDNGFIVSLSKEIREDEKLLYELQNIYENPEGKNNPDNVSAAQALGLIKEALKSNSQPPEAQKSEESTP